MQRVFGHGEWIASRISNRTESAAIRTITGLHSLTVQHHQRSGGQDDDQQSERPPVVVHHSSKLQIVVPVVTMLV